MLFIKSNIYIRKYLNYKLYMYIYIHTHTYIYRYPIYFQRDSSQSTFIHDTFHTAFVNFYTWTTVATIFSNRDYFMIDTTATRRKRGDKSVCNRRMRRGVIINIIRERDIDINYRGISCFQDISRLVRAYTKSIIATFR